MIPQILIYNFRSLMLHRISALFIFYNKYLDFDVILVLDLFYVLTPFYSFSSSSFIIHLYSSMLCLLNLASSSVFCFVVVTLDVNK